MRTIEQLLSHLNALDVKLWVEGDRLRLNTPKGVLTPELMDELGARKGEVIAFLQSANSVSQLSSLSIQPRAKDEVPPLSFSQQRLWFLDQFEPGNAAYNIPMAMRLKGTLNVAALQQALNEIVNRHEALRTNFDTLNDQPVQIIASPKPLPLTLIDLSELPSEEQIVEAKRLAAEEAKRPYDLRNDLLVRATLLKLNIEEHIFLLTMHHIVSDGWSITIFSREFAALYNAFINRQTSPLPPLPIQYADFACWQREWLKGERLSTQLAYWKQQLEGELPQLEMLLDKPRPPVQSNRSGRANLEIATSLSQALRRLSQQEDATLFMTLLAAFKLLLYRHTGLEDIIVGSPIAGRNWAEIENLIGFFLNTLVLRTNLSGNPSFRELINRVKKVATDAYSHQDIPFEKLLIELQPERDLSRTPIFQIFFNMLNLESEGAQLQGLTTEIFSTENIGSKFDLTLYLTEQGKVIDLTIVYNSDLFTPEKISELLSQYNYLLSQITVDPDKNLIAYSLVTPKSASVLPDPRQPLDASWHGAVHTQFSHNASQFPNNVALVDRSGYWTYQDLEHYSNQLAHFLKLQGLESQRVVAVYGHRSAALVWAILGILKAGGAFLILDPTYPVARQLNYLNIANPQGFIQLEAAGILPPDLETWASRTLGACRLSLSDGATSNHKGVLYHYPKSKLDLPIGPDDLAYIAFTSGSTGKPKGVLGRHGPLSHFLPWQCEIFNLSKDDRFSMLSGLSHDPLQRDIFTALWVGASIHIPNPDEIGTPGWLSQWMQEEQITFSHFTPAMAQLLAGNTSKTDHSKRQLPALRYAFFVGDKLTRNDVSQLWQLAPNVICINSYGSTETQRAVGYLTIDPKDISQISDEGRMGKAVIPVGQGMKDVQLLVLTSTQQLAGVGELGEIYIRSPHLAKGYLGDDSLTQERFITNPFTNLSGDRLYRSGDLGRFLPDGKVEFLGRKDTQVKIRGFRIELGEIETVLSKHPSVHQSVIAPWETDHGDKQLIAYVVPTNPDHCKSADLREFLQERLPAHMIPSTFVFLNTIPITPNGKINHSALPPPNQEQRGIHQEQVNARDITEEKLVRIWESVLLVKPIGVKDNFFELGGHSLMAVYMFTWINREFGVNLPLATLFQEATIEHLANVINRRTEPAIWSSLIKIEPHGDHPPFFCVHGITGDILWFRDLARYLAPNYPFYGLQSRGLDGIQSPLTRIEEMAAHYIQEIRLLQPIGPYHLGGASFGGTVALEIAQQLLAQGEQVSMLAIFDHSPIHMEPEGGKLKRRLIIGYRIMRNFPHWLMDFIQLGPSRMFMRIRRKLRLSRKAREQTDPAKLGKFDAEDLIDFASELPPYRQQVIASNFQAMKMYIPQPYPGQVTLFRAMSHQLLDIYDPELGWQKLAPGRVDVHDIPGSHEGMFKKPHVYYLAEKLRGCLGQA